MATELLAVLAALLAPRRHATALLVFAPAAWLLVGLRELCSLAAWVVVLLGLAARIR